MFCQEPELLFELRQGIEREMLRVDSSGQTALTQHAKALGSKLTHPHITTDYSENLVEIITGVHAETSKLLAELGHIHNFTQRNIADELLWPASMPAGLPGEDQIPLAYYGESNVGKLKTLYRKGLGHRYGRQMQSIAGVHYNFSMSDSFWSYYKDCLKSDKSLEEFKNEKYFHLIRNFFRYRWVLIYLFGSSPAVDRSFLVGRDHKLEKLNDSTFYTPEGISLRMGGLGYTSAAQESIGICYNQLKTYVETLEKARLESYPGYEKIGLKNGDEYLQLNTNLLQIDNEFYSTIRPKNIARTRESALMALHKRGIEYIEVRLLDVDPFSPLGISKEQVYFLHLFLLFCLEENSSLLSKEECLESEYNFNQVVLKGRAKSVQLKKHGKEVELSESLNTFMEKLKPLVKQLSALDSFYDVAFDQQLRKVNDKDLLPSQRVLDHLYGRSFLDFGTNLAREHRNYFMGQSESFSDLEKMAIDSFTAQAEVEANDKLSFDDFLVEYFKNIKIKF